MVLVTHGAPGFRTGYEVMNQFVTSSAYLIYENSTVECLQKEFYQHQQHIIALIMSKIVNNAATEAVESGIFASEYVAYESAFERANMNYQTSERRRIRYPYV